jgi:hypothetical protein
MSALRLSHASAADRCAGLLADISDRIERVLVSVTPVAAATVSATVAAREAGRPLRREDLAALRPLVADALRQHAGFAAGAGVVFAPGALADAPRWIQWWRPDLEQLQVDLDLESPEFYDYTTTEWYRVPERTGKRSVAGPYVDFICTHEYTFTLSMPLVDEGRFIGVAGADILATQVEQMALPVLSRLGRAAVLAGADGRVIASNTVSILPGMAISRHKQHPELVPLAGPSETLPWTLLS